MKRTIAHARVGYILHFSLSGCDMGRIGYDFSPIRMHPQNLHAIAMLRLAARNPVFNCRRINTKDRSELVRAQAYLGNDLRPIFALGVSHHVSTISIPVHARTSF